MPLGILFIVVALPLLEIAVMIKVGQAIGFWATVLALMLSAFVGLAIVNRQGLRTVAATMEQLAKGKPPVGAMADGMMLMIAGALLMAPGFVTDLVAFALLVPPVRHRVTRAWLRWMLRSAHARQAERQGEAGGRAGQRAAKPAAGPVIDGEFERLDEKTVDPDRTRRPPQA